MAENTTLTIPGTIQFTASGWAGTTTSSVGFGEGNGLASEAVLTAATAPVKPPLSYFQTSEPDYAVPMTYEDDGRVYGHLALWNSCHRGFMGGAFEQCVKPPRSNTDYAQFHLGHVVTEEGESVPVGKITFDTDHAPLTADVVAASRHYDNTGSVGAYVRASNGRHGIWLSGALRSDLPETGLVSLRANPLSGDWRSLNRNLELVASLAVPVPGFPIQRDQLALAASADGGITALILPALTEEDIEMEEVEEVEEPVTASASYHRQRYLRTQKRHEQDDWTSEEVAAVRAMTAATFTEAQRRRLARAGIALPDGSYPIRNCSDAKNARMAVERANPGDRARVRAHINSREKALGCSNGDPL